MATSAFRRMSQHMGVRKRPAYPDGSDSYYRSRLRGSRHPEFGPLFQGRKLSCSRGVDSLGCLTRVSEDSRRHCASWREGVREVGWLVGWLVALFHRAGCSPF